MISWIQVSNILVISHLFDIIIKSTFLGSTIFSQRTQRPLFIELNKIMCILAISRMIWLPQIKYWHHCLLILEIDCGPPALIPNAILVSEGTLFGNVSTYTCTGSRRVEDGRRVVVAVCGEDWRWSEQQFTCQGEWHRSHRNNMLCIALVLWSTCAVH